MLNKKEMVENIEILREENKKLNKEIERLNNNKDRAIFFIQNQELHKSKDTTGAITMKERELIDILLGSDKE